MRTPERRTVAAATARLERGVAINAPPPWLSGVRGYSGWPDWLASGGSAQSGPWKFLLPAQVRIAINATMLSLLLSAN